MKIFLPFHGKGSAFMGVGTFARKFKSGMEARGHEVFFEYRKDYDILFLIVQAPFKYLWEAKYKKKPIIQRLDGVWYWSVVGWKYPIFNLKAHIIRHFFADFTIYQSQFSKYCVEKFLGKKQDERSAIIYNGVDTNLFSPNGERIEGLRDNPNQHIFFTASSFRRQDQIVPIIEALKRYREKYGDNFKLFVAGPFRGKIENVPAKYADFKNIRFLGTIKNEDLPKYERSADVFLFTHFNPPCPNNVIEAFACGLPICGIADGAMPELVKHKQTGLLIETKGDAFWKKRSLNLAGFADNLHVLAANKRSYSLNGRSVAKNQFTLSQMIDKYIAVLS